MQVLALVTDAWNGRGGIAQYNRDLLGALAALEDISKIHVMARHAPDFGEQLPQKISMTSPLGKASFASKALLHAFKMEEPYIVFCGHINFLRLALTIARIRTVPVWLQTHGIEIWDKPKDVILHAVENVQLVTAVSRFTRSKLLSWSNLPPSRAKVLPNTVDARFKPGEMSDDLIRRYGISGKKVLLTVSRMSSQEKYKGHDLVINALPDLLKNHPDTCYLIVGEGDDRCRLEKLAVDQAVDDQVIFAGAVPHEELLDHYRLANVFVMPSTGEGFGIAFLEAASCGIDVIGCDQDGSRDPLRDGLVGQVVKANKDEVRDAIDRSLNGSNGSSDDVNVFHHKNFNKRVGEIYSQCFSDGIYK